MAILRLLSKQSTQGVTAIARTVGISPSSCFNILRTLEAERAVAFDARSKTYGLGAGLADLAGRALDPDNAFAFAQQRLAALARETGATCALWRVLPENRLVLLGSQSNGQAARIHLEAGQRLPLPLGAAGRSVVAALDLRPEDIARQFAEVRWDRPPSLKGYMQEIERAREVGWSLDDGAYISGVTTVGAAVRDALGTVRLSVSTVFFSGQRSPDELARAGSATAAAAADISALLYGMGVEAVA
jgi:DNA-binding IclR family transcriptional regulator